MLRGLGQAALGEDQSPGAAAHKSRTARKLQKVGKIIHSECFCQTDEAIYTIQRNALSKKADTMPATVNFSCRLVPEVPEALRRLTVITRRSQPQLLESLILNFENRWLSCFTDEERRRYEAGSMNYVEAFEIRRRALKRREPVPPQPVNAHAARSASFSRATG